MPRNMADDLEDMAGITPADYPQFLATDPFGTDPEGLAQPAPERYECTEQLYYQPGSTNVENYEISNSYTSSTSTSSSQQYTIKLAFEGTFLNLKLNAANTWTWKNSTSTSNSVTNGATVKLNLTQPSSAYTGFTVVSIYIDKMYKTLMYSFRAPAITNANCWSEGDLTSMMGLNTQ